MSVFKAVYLLAGSGSRLRPLTDTTPKSLLEINGRPILSRSVDTLLANGIHELVVVTGYLEDQIKTFFRNSYPKLTVTYICNEEYATTNNSYSLWHARSGFAGEGMILLDGDILFEQKIMDALVATDPNKNVLAVRRSGHLGAEEMKVMLGRGNRIMAIAKTLEPSACYGESIGIEKFSPAFTKKLFEVLDRRMNRENGKNEYYEASFQELIGQGESVEMLDTHPYRCMEIDTFEDLEAAKKEILPFIDKDS